MSMLHPDVIVPSFILRRNPDNQSFTAGVIPKLLNLILYYKHFDVPNRMIGTTIRFWNRRENKIWKCVY